jgi:hypothetical protein
MLGIVNSMVNFQPLGLLRMNDFILRTAADYVWETGEVFLATKKASASPRGSTVVCLLRRQIFNKVGKSREPDCLTAEPAVERVDNVAADKEIFIARVAMPERQQVTRVELAA